MFPSVSSVSSAFFYRSQLVALPQPAEVLHAHDLASYSRCVRHIQQHLARQGGFVTGLLPYSCGKWRMPSGSSYQPDNTHNLANAVFHIHNTSPTPVHDDNDHREQATRSFSLLSPFLAEQTQVAYVHAIQQIQAYLAAGDAYQVNLAQRFRARCTGDSYTAWRHLLAEHPAPHACYFDAGESTVFGVSPERFLSIKQQRVVTEPIKGSRPRGNTDMEDAALAHDLQHHPKDRSENLMIVDLLRNDLGALCEPGSVTTSPLFELRKFSNVQHLVSTISGTLRETLHPLDALLAAFPGGSITGAPKKRAMEIIEELEPAPRGAYCGSFFWMNDEGEFDSNILIRSLQVTGDEIVCHGGGGIVFDSEPNAEYAESRFKVERLMEVLEREFLPS